MSGPDTFWQVIKTFLGLSLFLLVVVIHCSKNIIIYQLIPIIGLLIINLLISMPWRKLPQAPVP